MVNSVTVSLQKGIQLFLGGPLLGFKAVGIDIHSGGAAGVSQIF